MLKFKNRLIDNEDQHYLDTYLNNLARLNKSAHTIKNYRADIEKFLLWLKDHKKISITKVNGEVISEYKEFLMNGGAVYSQLKNSRNGAEYFLWFSVMISQVFFKKSNRKRVLFFQNPMSVSSRRRHLSSLKNFFEYLKEAHEDSFRNKFSKNPVKNKIHSITLKDVDVVSTKMIQKEEFNLIYENSYRTEDRLILDLLYFGGLRLSELCHLEINNFDLENKTITFIRKGGSRHQLQIQNAEQIFRNFLFYIQNKKIESKFLFSNNKGQVYSIKAMYNKIMAILKRNSIRSEITPHSFRKACATNLYRQTLDLLLVRDYLNHSDAKVTQTYIDTGVKNFNNSLSIN